MGHSDVHPQAGRRVGGTHRPLSLGQSGSVVCSHRSSVCTCGGTWIPARGLAAGSGGLLDSTRGHGLQAPHKPARPALSHPRPLLSPRFPLPQRSSCSYKDVIVFLSEQSPETLVKIPSFPFGEGVGTSGQRHPVRSLLWVSGKAPVHTHPFLVHTHPSPGLKP